MSKYTKYNIFDIVRLKNVMHKQSGVILDYDFRSGASNIGVVYEVWFSGRRKQLTEGLEVWCKGKRNWIPEDSLEQIGRKQLPLQFNQEVLIHESVFEQRDPVSGVITGIAWEPETNKWDYAVELRDESILGVSQNEVLPSSSVKLYKFQKRVSSYVSPKPKLKTPARISNQSEIQAGLNAKINAYYAPKKNKRGNCKSPKTRHSSCL